jgi:hypothetical protein
MIFNTKLNPNVVWDFLHSNMQIWTKLELEKDKKISITPLVTATLELIHNPVQSNSLFIYVLTSTATGQLQSQHELKQQQQDNAGRNKQKQNKKPIS